ncbi:MAG: glutathione binding-like protein [Halieaceae bacterium]
MDYASVTEARHMPGLRLVLTAGVPGPWGEAIKSILQHKQLDYIPVKQLAGEENAELYEWTGQSSAPVALYNEEPPRSSWLDQLLLAERLAPDRALLPADLEQRALVIGLSRELAGEGGLGWNRRLQLLGLTMLSGDAPAGIQRMAAKYGWSESAHATSAGRIAECLQYFATRLRMQQRLQSDYIVGSALTAADLYLVNFLGMLQPLPPELNPMPDYLRQVYEYTDPAIADSLEPLLFEYRDQVYARHISTPLEF